MMRDDSDDESFGDGPPPPKTFSSKIEEELGYEVDDPAVRDEIAEEFYNPKPKAEFGFDARVAQKVLGAVPENPNPRPAEYVANKSAPAPASGKPNLVAGARGYVMPSAFGEDDDGGDEEIDEKFGYGTPSPPVGSVNTGGGDKEMEDPNYKPYSPLAAVKETQLEDDDDVQSNASSERAPRIITPTGKVGDRIRVAVRLRPLRKDEMVSKRKKKEENKENFMAWTVDVDDELDYMLEKRARGRKEGQTIFHIDRVYEETDYTEALYEDMVSPIIKGAIGGQHGTIFAYGPTGTGKSFTIQGGGAEKGMIQMACRELFDIIGSDNTREYIVKAGYFDIYNEQVRDLMGQDEADQGVKSRRATACVTTVNKSNVELPILNVREDAKTGDVYVDTSFQKVSNTENVIRLLHKGNRNRVTEKTEQNNFSSRSHAIFRIIVESHERIDEDADTMDEGITVRSAVVNFVDLAGSESNMKAATKGKRQAEGGKINQSLLALSQVINALSQPAKKQPKFINYRDSKLTRVLQPHLSGNAIMSIICTASPSKKYLEETRATLKFAANAKRIKLKPKVNESVDDRALVETLKRELHEARMKIMELEDRLSKAGPAIPEGHVVVPADQVGTGGGGGGGSEFPMLERFMSQMNMSVKSDAFFDAADEISQEEEDEDEIERLRQEVLAKFTDDEESSEDEPNPADDDEDGDNAEDDAEDGEPTENEEAEIERIRQEALAKFMSGFDDDDFPDESEPAENVDGNVNETAQTLDETRDSDDLSNAHDAKAEESRENEAIETKEKDVPAQPSINESKGEAYRSEPEKPEHAEMDREIVMKESSEPEKKKSFLDDDSSDDMNDEPINEKDLDLIEKFREEILEKFRDEIVDEEAAHELDENAQNVAVIANELINKFKKDIVSKYKDEFPDIFKHTDITAMRVGDSGIVGRVIERDTNASSEGNLATTDDDSDNDGEPEQFEDEFDEDAKFSSTPNAQSRTLPQRSYSQQTDLAMVNGKPAREHSTETPVHSSLGRGTSGSVSSDLSSDVANNKNGSHDSPLAAAPPEDDEYEDGQIPFGEIAISKDQPPGVLDDKMKIKFLQEKLAATDELVETLFVELDNAKSFIRELVFESASNTSGSQGGTSLFGPAGTSGVTVVDEQILKQCEILKFTIYVSLLFFVFGQHELFLATVFFLWLSLEVATKA